MATKQTYARILVNQINELAEKLSSLIESDSENLRGYTITQATSVPDEEGHLKMKSIIGGSYDDIEIIQTDLMTETPDYLAIMSFSWASAYESKKSSAKELLNKALPKN